MSWKITLERLRKVLVEIADSSTSSEDGKLEAKRQLLQLKRLEALYAGKK